MFQSRKTLICLFAGTFTLLLAFTIRAGQVRSVFDNGALMSDVWFQVTLLDVYLGFITVYVWIAWKEETLVSRVLWFVLVMSFGNMAISAYVLMQLLKLPSGSGLFELLTTRSLTSDAAQQMSKH
jgi:hypothetical protein